MNNIEIKAKQFSVRIDGKFNPAILNHDFLVKINAIPHDTGLPESTVIPVMASLDYSKLGVRVVVDLEHFQVSQEDDSEPGVAIRLAKSYIGRLGDTPVERLLFNFCGDVVFRETASVADFEAWLLRDKASLISNLGATKLSVMVQLRYDFDEFTATTRMGPIDPEHESMNFLSCYEKNLSKAQDVVSLLDSESIVSRIMKAPSSQLRDFCMGREARE
ncbi:hypothetical protein J7M28_07560 [bacterium]|nr:hypothetical protein [bacterium]